jgi:hypothetical protein
LLGPTKNAELHARHEEGTLHDLSDHDNIPAVLCDAQAQVNHGVLDYLYDADNGTVAPPTMGPGCQITPTDDSWSGLRHSHTTHASEDTNQHL